MKKTSQQGLTMLSIAFLLVVIGSVTLLVLKILPIYMDNFKVENSLESLQEEDGLTKFSNHKIRDLLERRLQINMVRVDKDDITVTRKDGTVSVNVSYEVTEHIVGNLDVLVYFDETIEVSGP